MATTIITPEQNAIVSEVNVAARASGYSRR